MSIILLILILVISLATLIKGADFFVNGAKSIGLKMGMSPFAIGVIIVGMGTSLPELASSIAAVFQNQTTVVLANVVGSNIANILLIVGVMALLSRKIVIRRDLLKSELPLFVIATAHFLFIISDGVVNKIESFLLLGTFLAYLWYIIKEPPSDIEISEDKKEKENNNIFKSIGIILIGLIGIIAGAHFTVYSSIELASLVGIPLSVVTILGIAVGTSLPELMVSVSAVKSGDADLAIGNIFGSNAINMLLVVGIPALITNLYADEVVMELGVSILLAASVIFFVHGLSRRLMRWEGAMLLLFFIFFVIQLFNYI
ncbi:MAG: calcium/sodium antiporter [Candidatus Pacebacteria bacterium]|nr:calcium/sodium antiporter [Candidatus Paceibacterota bacterium]MDD4074342.1 calcium/sodium antiporter [Candidatus Paceibacterota bacterium]